jgi:hypothetical protein
MTLALAKQLTNPLNKYGLKNKIKTYVKDESSNLNTMKVNLNGTKLALKLI